MSHRMLSLVAGVAAMSLISASGQVLAQCSHGAGQQMKHSGHDESEAGHSHEMATVHGGQVTMTPHHHFEVLFTDKQARVYVYDDKQKPITDPEHVKATMSLMTKDGKSETMDLKYIGPDQEKGRTQGYFYVDRDMSGVKDGDLKAIIKMMKLEKDSVEFRTPVTIGQHMSYVCPMKDSAPAEDPGKCPKCGMQMTMMETGEHMGMQMDHGAGHGADAQHH